MTKIYVPTSRSPPKLDELIGRTLFGASINDYQSLEKLVIETDQSELNYRRNILPAITFPLNVTEHRVIVISEGVYNNWGKPEYVTLCTLREGSEEYKKFKETPFKTESEELNPAILMQLDVLSGSGEPSLGIEGRKKILDLIENEITTACISHKYGSGIFHLGDIIVGIGEPLKKEGARYEDLVVVINPKERQKIENWEKIVDSPDFKTVDEIRKYLAYSWWKISTRISKKVEEPVLKLSLVPEYHVTAAAGAPLDVKDYYGLYDRIGETMEVAVPLENIKVRNYPFAFKEKKPRPYLPITVRIQEGLKHPRSHSDRPCEELLLPPRIEELNVNVVGINFLSEESESVDTIILNPGLASKFPNYYGVWNGSKNANFLKTLKSEGGIVRAYIEGQGTPFFFL